METVRHHEHPDPPALERCVEDLSDAALLGALSEAFAARRLLDARLSRLAGEVAARCHTRADGSEGIARSQGQSSAAALLADLGRIGMAEASRLARVGGAVANRFSLFGEPLAARFPVLADGFATGRIPLDSANSIVQNLTHAAPRANPDDLTSAEIALVEFALENPADFVRKLAIRWRDALDVDGVEPREDALRELRELTRTVRANGMRRYILDLDPLSAAFLDSVIDAEIMATLRAPTSESASASASASADSTALSVEADREGSEDHRTIAQIGADAIVDLARHGLGCSDTTAAMNSAAVVVRMDVDALRTGLGQATIDGSGQPISAGTARRLAADTGIIPLVLGGASEPLDLGRTRRLFSRAQRLALAERDDGCAWSGCHRAPQHAEAHHLAWWSNGGATDLANGVLLCTFHHHRIHDDGWRVTNQHGDIWFTPPAHIDPTRTPRRGSRRAAIPRARPD